MINYGNIPQEIRGLKQWVNSNMDSKVPLCPYENRSASSVDKTTWGTFLEAVTSYEEGIYDYVGFVFADNGYVGIDIDAGFDEDGFITPLAADIIDHCKSYTEISRSGRGFHIIVKGSLPFKGKNNLKGVEIYKASRYFIMTGDLLLGMQEIHENQSAIDYVCDTYFEGVKESSDQNIHPKIYTLDWSSPIRDGRLRLFPDFPTITSGSRNLSLTSLAGQLHSLGYPYEAIYKYLVRCNKLACKPCLDEREIESITNSITKYVR